MTVLFTTIQALRPVGRTGDADVSIFADFFFAWNLWEKTLWYVVVVAQKRESARVCKEVRRKSARYGRAEPTQLGYKSKARTWQGDETGLTLVTADCPEQAGD